MNGPAQEQLATRGGRVKQLVPALVFALSLLPTITSCSSSSTSATTEPATVVGSASCVDLSDDVSAMLNDGTSPIEPTTSMDLQRATIDSDSETMRLTWTTLGTLDSYDPSRPGSGVGVMTEMRWTLDDAWAVSVDEPNGALRAGITRTTGGAVGSTDYRSATVTVAVNEVTVTVPVSALPGLPARFVWRTQVFGLQGTPLNGLPYFMGVDQCGTTVVNSSSTQPFWGHAVFPGDVTETSQEPLQADAAIIPQADASTPATTPPATQPTPATTTIVPATSTSPAATGTEPAPATVPTPSAPVAPWAGAAVPAPDALGGLPAWWYQQEEPSTGCPLLAPTATVKELGATGPPDDPMIGTASDGPFISWPGATAPWMSVYEPPLDANDPALQPYFTAEAAITTYADGSVERIVNGNSLILLPGFGCGYEFGTTGPMSSARALFISLRIVEAPPSSAPTTTAVSQTNPTTADPCPEPGVDVMREGDGIPDGCDSVTQLQQLLIANGYPVAADGRFGADTASAVRAFQQDHGLAVDGLVGPMTWTTLLAADTDY